MKLSNFFCVIFVFFSFSSSSVAQCIIAEYPFNANANDVSGNNFHGTVIGGATLTDDRNGNANSAYYFDGVDDYISVGNIIDVQSQSGMTISAWFKPDASFGSNNLFTGIDFGKRSTGKITLRMTDNTTYNDYEAMLASNDDQYTTVSFSDDNINYTEWTHVAGVYQDDRVKLYINGVEQADSLRTGAGGFFSNIATGVELYIGKSFAHSGIERYFKGVIDDIKIYNCALSTNEIIDDFNQNIGDCIIAEYPFNANANDISGNDFHGTVNGGATLTDDRNGNPNSAYYFDGVDDYISAGNIIDVQNQSGMTISAWFKPDSSFVLDNYFSGIDFGKRSTGRITLRMTDNGTYNDFQAMIASNNDQDVTTSFSDENIDYNSWTHVAGVYQDDLVKLYINGVEQADSLRTGTGGFFSNIATGIELYIGKSFSNNNVERYFKGAIDDIKIYNCALSSNEIIDDYISNTKTLEAESILYYPNPTNGEVNIDLGIAYERAHCILTDIKGQLIQSKIYSGQKIKMDISNLPSGTYLLNLTYGKKQITLKVIKE